MEDRARALAIGHGRGMRRAAITCGVDAAHVVDERPAEPHRLTPFARVVDGRATYPRPDRPLDDGRDA